MQKRLSRNKQALSSLSLIILLLIAAIIGGIISYLWVTGYYMSLKEKTPEQDTAAITNLSFNPQNATAFNVTLLNPSYSPSDKIEVSEIGYIGQNENTLHPVLSSIPSLSTPFNLTRGTSQTFICRADLTPYVNQTLWVSAFVVNGSGSTNFIKIPYTQLLIPKIDFNTTIGVKNFTITLQNAPLSAANLTITTIRFDKQPVFNTTNISPTLPLPLAPNKTVALLISGTDGNWSSYASAGGPQYISVLTKEGYSANSSTTVPRLAFLVKRPNFNENDTKHFTVAVQNEVSTNTALNVSRIEVTLDNGTVEDVTPALNSTTNGVRGNSNATFNASWDWTRYRDRSVIVAVYTLQGVREYYNQTIITPALSILNTTFPDSQHVLVTVKNSQYSARVANVTNMTVTLENGTEKQIQITQPPASPYLVGIGNETMFNAYWNWQTYGVNKTVKVNIYTDEGLVTSYTTRTPASLANYTVYLTIPSTPIFNTTNTAQFEVTVSNNQASTGNATITKITVLLVNGTEKATTFTPQTIAPTYNTTFTCLWNWATYHNESIVILVYTNGGLKAIYVTKTAA